MANAPDPPVLAELEELNLWGLKGAAEVSERERSSLVKFNFKLASLVRALTGVGCWSRASSRVLEREGIG